MAEGQETDPWSGWILMMTWKSMRMSGTERLTNMKTNMKTMNTSPMMIMMR